MEFRIRHLGQIQNLSELRFLLRSKCHYYGITLIFYYFELQVKLT